MVRISILRPRLKKWYQKHFNEGTEAYIAKVSDTIKINENHVNFLVKAINDNNINININEINGGESDRAR